MRFCYRNGRLRKECENDHFLAKNQGTVHAGKIQLRWAPWDVVEGWAELEALPGRHHEWNHDKAGWISCDLDGPC